MAEVNKEAEALLQSIGFSGRRLTDALGNDKILKPLLAVLQEVCIFDMYVVRVRQSRGVLIFHALLCDTAAFLPVYGLALFTLLCARYCHIFESFGPLFVWSHSFFDSSVRVPSID